MKEATTTITRTAKVKAVPFQFTDYHPQPSVRGTNHGTDPLHGVLS